MLPPTLLVCLHQCWKALVPKLSFWNLNQFGTPTRKMEDRQDLGTEGTKAFEIKYGAS